MSFKTVWNLFMTWLGVRGSSHPSSQSPAPNVPAVAADELAPTEITDYSVTAAVGQLIHACDQSADRYDTRNAIAGSGVNSYGFYTGSGALINSPTLPAANIQAQGSKADISTGVGSITYNATDGNRFTITNTGAYNDVADPITLADYLSKTGDYTVVTCIESMAGSGSQWAQGGVTIRESTAAGSIYASVCWFQSGASKAVQFHCRTATNAAFTAIASVTGINASKVYIKLARVANQFTASYSWDNTPNSWATIGSTSFAMASTALYGAFAWSQDAAAVTVGFYGFKVVPSTRLSYTQTTASAVTSKAIATDAKANSTAYTGSVTVTPLVSPPPNNSISWHPKHGIVAAWTDGGTDYTSVTTQWAQMAPYDSLFGFGHLIVYISKFYDGTTYTWANLDQFVTFLQSTSNFTTPKKFTLELQTSAFGRTHVGDGTSPFPASWVSNGWTKYIELDPVNHTGTWYIDMENAGAAAALAGVVAQLGAHFNGNAAFEYFHMFETALYNPGPMRTIALAMKAAFPNKNVGIGHNYFVAPTYTDDKNFVAFCVANGIGVGGPDIHTPASNNQETSGQLALRGAGVWTFNNGFGPFDFGTTDNRGNIPNFLQRQVIWGPTDMQLAQYAQSQKCTHVGWLCDSVAVAAGHTMATTTAAIAAYPAYTNCPVSYSGACDTT